MESWTVEFWEENSASCMEKLNEELNWSKIPILNTFPSHLLKDGQLVRFRGMVQDMFNPVYYMAKYKVYNTITQEESLRSGKYKDSLQCGEHENVLLDSDECEHLERRPLYCITVPAVNSWAQDNGKVNKLTETSTEEPCTNRVKRSVEPDDSMEVESSRPAEDEVAKRLCTTNTTMNVESSAADNGTINLNLPIPDDQAKACLINLYDLDETSSLKMNDIIEAAGFLSFDTAHETGEQFLPPSLVPRLHAVVWKKIDSTPVTHSGVVNDAIRLRDELRLVLSQLLLGDALAADYLICHLMSRVYLRQDMLVLGKFSLNLSNMPCLLADYTNNLYKFLQKLLEKSHYLPMTIETMNSTVMVPKKNYETNRLDSGMLQLSSKTHLILDETKLEPGRLNDRGVRNCQALSSVITYQRLEYDFQFYPVEFHTDIPVLILSEGKSMLPSDCLVVLQPDPSCFATINEVFDAASHYLQEPLLAQLRNYLLSIAYMQFDLSNEVQKMVQEDFVKMRQENKETSAQDLHSLLVLARYISLSEGCQSLTKQCWERALKMERERKQRLTNLYQR